MTDTGAPKEATPEGNIIDFSSFNFPRLAHNFLHEAKNGSATLDDINLLNDYVINHLLKPEKTTLPKYKVGVVFVCINQPYWQYMKPVIDGVRQFFLPGHDTEIMCWSDMPRYPEAKDVNYGATIFPTESVEWPYPTLMRYHLFLQQEEYLKKFDYLFYLDLDMRVVNVVGDEILPAEGLMGAQHPMYALDKKYIPPYEPNPASASYIPRPGRILTEGGKQRYETLYFAGGFQGGRTEPFIEAMKGTRDLIDADFKNGYIPIWNDETAWNKYLFEHPPEVVLDPSYVYPDSMPEYYRAIWGRDYTPRIYTITKPFTLSKEGGAAAAAHMAQMKGL